MYGQFLSGDQADPDDWAATPMMLALLAKTGLQNRLVHVDYNNKFLIKTKACEHYDLEMRKSILAAAAAFAYELNLFFDDEQPAQRDAGMENLRREMLRSSEDDPLFIVVAGAFHFIYEAAQPIKGQYSHVYLIQRSPDNARNNQGAAVEAKPIFWHWVVFWRRILPGRGRKAENDDRSGKAYRGARPCASMNWR